MRVVAAVLLVISGAACEPMFDSPTAPAPAPWVLPSPGPSPCPLGYAERPTVSRPVVCVSLRT
jgi:hypothetical protein